jgi:hypothetical protein
MHTRRHSLPSIVDSSSYSVAAVAFYGGAAVGESREQNEAAEDKDNISHVGSLFINDSQLKAKSRATARNRNKEERFQTARL